MSFPRWGVYPQYLGTSYAWNLPGNPPTGDSFYTSRTYTGVNYGSTNPKINGRYRPGGMWFMQKEEGYVTPSASTAVFRKNSGMAYRGGFIASHIPGGISHAPSTSASNVNNAINRSWARGAEAWNRLRPDKPRFDALQALAELKDLPGMYKAAVRDVKSALRHKYPEKYKGKRPSNLAEHYLAMQFGWIPLQRDIQKFVKEQLRLDAELQRIIKQAGRPQRRRVNLQSHEGARHTTQTMSASGGSGHVVRTSPVLVTQCYTDGNLKKAHMSTTQTVEHITWAAGAFRYLLPPGPRTRKWKRALKRKIMGLRVSPSLMYELVPWSWLVDYFTDVGQFTKAISPGFADRLICDSAYICTTSRWTYVTEASLGVWTSSSNDSKSVQMSTVNIAVRKVRVHASPFGFGVKQSDLNPKQVSILGALGYSKLS